MVRSLHIQLENNHNVCLPRDNTPFINRHLEDRHGPGQHLECRLSKPSALLGLRTEPSSVDPQSKQTQVTYEYMH